MKIRRTLVCALAALVLTTFFACAPKQTASLPETLPAETAKARTGLDKWGREPVASAVPGNKKFSGEKVNIAIDESQKQDFFSDALNGDLMNDAVYNRNLKVENDLEVQLNFILFDGSDTSARRGFVSKLTSAVLSGTGDFDLAAGFASYMTGGVRNDAFMNLRELEEISSLDFGKPWWNRSYVERVTVNGKLFTVVGDCCLSGQYDAGCLFFNKRLADEHLAALGGSDGLYRLVEEEKWTFDAFTDIVKDLYNDADGDGQRSDGDLYGFASRWTASIPVDFFMAGMDAPMTEKGPDGIPELMLKNENSARTVAAIDKLVRLKRDCAGAYFNPSWYNNPDAKETLLKMFTDGRLLFLSRPLFQASELKNMNDDFGLLPMPKFDAEQKGYRTSQFDGYFCFVAAADVEDPRGRGDLAGTVLEKFCEESWRTVSPNYFETVMKYRYLRTDTENRKDLEMYDLILASNTFDFGMVYSAALDFCYDAVREAVKNNGNFASAWETKEMSAVNRFDALIRWLTEDDGE
ncbi:MAG: hypothetical protein IJV00_07305 [Clostridia bacterium]|nr:hypothetical protein [Clostridia bacterium]